ncbi:hypothetical protein EK21DRAFT_90641 [Setomelanomma holmii]|uniref:Uncharacterized protein n=1 Tax=Setomelanomma holmii TaxID=210430 RepID=A0A9P4LIW9_9PLEO|nr:hypothetical protein EK21DRAFT_90641 [Setomelanomma holmii]
MTEMWARIANLHLSEDNRIKIGIRVRQDVHWANFFDSLDIDVPALKNAAGSVEVSVVIEWEAKDEMEEAEDAEEVFDDEKIDVEGSSEVDMIQDWAVASFGELFV